MKLADVGVGTIDLRAQVEAPHFSAAGELVEPTAVVCVLSWKRYGRDTPADDSCMSEIDKLGIVVVEQGFMY